MATHFVHIKMMIGCVVVVLEIIELYIKMVSQIIESLM